MIFSYWENKTWLSNIDFVVVGSGIVGLNCALELRTKHPKSKIVVLEKGLIPHGASSRNAGFACFGSITEIISDLDTHSPSEVYELIQKRVLGLSRLRKLLGDKQIKYKQFGGNEIFLQDDYPNTGHIGLYFTATIPANAATGTIAQCLGAVHGAGHTGRAQRTLTAGL